MFLRRLNKLSLATATMNIVKNAMKAMIKIKLTSLLQKSFSIGNPAPVLSACTDRLRGEATAVQLFGVGGGTTV